MHAAVSIGEAALAMGVSVSFLPFAGGKRLAISGLHSGHWVAIVDTGWKTYKVNILR